MCSSVAGRTYEDSSVTDFIQAKNYTPASRTALRLIVIHTMESPEKPGTARAVANWFASAGAPQASAHACIGPDEIVLCVYEKDVAWAAPGANRDGYHIEHAGRAAQSDADWADAASVATLAISAAHAADVAHRYGIPVQRLTVAQVADGVTKGFCGHVDVTAAFPKLHGSHTDPGPHFPWESYIEQVTGSLAVIENDAAAAPTDPAPPPSEAA